MSSELLKSIRGHIFRNVGQYYEKFFAPHSLKSPSIAGERFHMLRKTTHHDAFNNRAHEEILFWLVTLSSDEGLYWHKAYNKDTGISSLQLSGELTLDQQKESTFIRAIGVVVGNESRLYRHGFTELCTIAASVFEENPLRLFLHGFIIWGTIMELWTIDRSGLYSCEPFDLCHDTKRVLDVLNAYNTLQEHELGANTFVKYTKDGPTVFTAESSTSHVQALYLNDKVNGSIQGIINDSPIVYLAGKAPHIGPDMVVKFKWRREFLHSEGDYFTSMNRPSPPGVVQHYHSHDIRSTSDIRAGLVFGDAVTLCAEDDDDSNLGGDENKLPTCFVKRQPDSPGNEAYMNRILSCIALYPRGVPLEEYQTPVQVIKAFRDALQGHRVLYQQCGILHRDIAPPNILLANATFPASTNSPAGFLIDIEGALSSRLPPKRSQIVGTRTFNAIRLLQLETPQTYRGDLESFLYSLVWFCVHRRSSTHKPPSKSRLERWNGPLGEELAKLKLDDMAETNFSLILDEFHPDFQPFRGLADGVRKLLFPMQADGSLWTGTDESDEGPNALYDGMLKEFDDALSTSDIHHRG